MVVMVVIPISKSTNPSAMREYAGDEPVMMFVQIVVSASRTTTPRKKLSS